MIKANNHHSSSQQPIPSKKRERIGLESFLSRKHFRFLAFLVFIVVFFFISFLYFLNLLQWSRGPDFGWSVSHQIVGFVFVEVYGEAEKAGLQVGDRIVSVNDVKVDSYSQVQQNLSRESTEENRYEVERQGQLVKVRVPNKPLGFGKAFQRFGLTWVLGLVFFSMGVIVFSMKPGTRPSWAFLIMMFSVALHITFLFTSKLTPAWLNFVQIFPVPFLPASVLQLTQTFPVERPWVQKHLWSLWAPYVFSMIIFLIMISSASRFIDVSPLWRKIALIYQIGSLLLFLASNGFAYIKSPSVIAQMRSKVILIGSALAIVFPVANLVTTIFFQLILFRNPIFNLPFFIFFPLSISYAIAKHNLFDIDAIIKRTYGYILTTGTIAGVYGLVVLITNLAFRGFEITKSPLFPLFFVLAVVFLFNPIRNRVQKFIDRVFYRLEYDYQETVQRISGTMRYLQSLDQIRQKIVDTILGVMFIDSCGIILVRADQKAYEGLNISYDYPITKLELPSHDPLIKEVAEKKKEVTIYDIQEDPAYEKDRGAFRRAFDQLKATLILPLIYEDRLIGIMTLGSKKSGKFYNREDIDLLRTMANQGAVAIENARLVDQMKNEEKVRLNLARYLSPQIVDQVIKKDVEVDLGGDRKVVTILFSDIRNFTRISESLPPDKLVQLLNEYFTEMARIIFENQGSLDKYIGDAIVAVFGSLISLENSGETAVRAAVQMMKQMSALNESWKKEYGFKMEMGIGINTGEVFLGNVGSPERMEFTVIGDTVNIASRFSGVAHGEQILITKETLAQLGPDIKYRTLPPVEVKGKTGKLEVFEIVYR